MPSCRAFLNNFDILPDDPNAQMALLDAPTALDGMTNVSQVFASAPIRRRARTGSATRGVPAKRHGRDPAVVPSLGRTQSDGASGYDAACRDMNCSSSLEPVSAVVLAFPAAAAWATRSK